MKYILFFIALFFLSCQDNSSFFKQSQRIAFIGDSITAAGGYIENIEKYFKDNHADLKLSFYNHGLSSETVSGLSEAAHPSARPWLYSRLDAIINESNPDVIFFCYGINDGIYQPFSDKHFTRYKEGVERFIQEMKARNIEVILLTPTPLYLSEKIANMRIYPEVSPDVYAWNNPYPRYNNEVLSKYKEFILQQSHPIIKKVIDVYTPLWEGRTLAYNNEKDGIHPLPAGHKIMSDAILNSLGYSGY